MVDVDSRAADERKRYTTRLQRRAQAHVTNELGRENYDDGIDRQVAMLIQHVSETTAARRVTLYRPITKGQRWLMVTVLDDGGYYYGLVSPDYLTLPSVIHRDRQPVTMGPGRPFDVPVSATMRAQWRSYVGLPLISDDAVVAVLEAVDVAQPEHLDRHVQSIEQAVAALTEALSRDAQQDTGGTNLTAAPPTGMTGEMVLDTVLRPPGEMDEVIAMCPDEWALITHLDGNRSFSAATTHARLTPARAEVVAAGLLERGLIRAGRDTRRR